jgi:hypothetical protein
MVENSSMGTGNQTNISLKPWMNDAVKTLAEREKKSLSRVVNELLTIQLEKEGFSEGAFVAKQRGREGDNLPDVIQPTTKASGHL